MGMQSSNPVFKDGNAFQVADPSDSLTMTVGGTVAKTAILLCFLLIGFGFTWQMATESYSSAFAEAHEHPRYNDKNEQLPDQISIPPPVYGYATIGCIGAFFLAMYTIWNPRTAGLTAPIYAVLEGMALGAISAGFEAKYPGIAFQSAGLTFGTLAGMLMVYSTGAIKPTIRFYRGLISVMLAILGVYIVNLLLMIFGNTYLPIVMGNSWSAIGFSAFVCVIAALNFVIDFDQIERSVKSGAPKCMEWYSAFGLMLTLVWLYLEIIRLLAKVRSK